MDVFATNLRERAAELGLSNAEVARRSGLSERRYGHYVSGIREPDLATLVRIAQSLGTTPDRLLGLPGGGAADPHQLVVERIVAAVSTLDIGDLQIIAIQVDALASARRKVPRP